MSLPKTEIHLHLEALASANTIWLLIKKHKLAIPHINSKKDLINKFKIKNLTEFIFLYINVIQNSFQKIEDIDYLISDTEEYLLQNNIVYAEIFFSPSKFLLNGFSFKDMVDRLDAGASRLKKQSDLELRFIIDVSRSFGPENAMKNLNLTLENRRKSIIGIGLGGAESQGPAKEYAGVFQKAIKNNLKVVAHAGEDVDSWSIWDAIKHLKVQRIGHGTSAMLDEKLIRYLSEKKIPLEVCPTSNIITRKYVTAIENHPVRMFYDRGINLTINTDDPILFGISLVDEYMNLWNNDIFTAKEIVELIHNNLYASFLPEKRKVSLWKTISKLVKEKDIASFSE